MSIVLILENTLNNIGNAIRSRLFPDEYNKRKLYPREMEEAINSIYDYNVEYMYGIDERQDGQYWCGNMVKSMKNAFFNSHMRREVYPVCGPNVKDMSYAYYNCMNTDWGNPETGSFACGPLVTNMSHCYQNCHGMWGYQPYVGDEVIDMSYAYSSTFNSIMFEGGEGQQCLYNQARLLYGNNSIAQIYYNEVGTIFQYVGGVPVHSFYFAGLPEMNDAKPSLHYVESNPVCKPKVTNMAYAYENCFCMMGEPACGDNVIDMSGTYKNCFRLTGRPVCGPKVESFQNAYRGCVSLYGTPKCVDTITNMDNTYNSCYNLDGEPQCGPAVLDMAAAYMKCFNIRGIANVGDKVRNMALAYAYCNNLEAAKIGTRVENADRAFMFCTGLTGKGMINAEMQPYLNNLYATFMGSSISEAELTINPEMCNKQGCLYMSYAMCNALTKVTIKGRPNITVSHYSYGDYYQVQFPFQNNCSNMVQICHNLKTVMPIYPGLYPSGWYLLCPNIEGNIFWGTPYDNGYGYGYPPTISRSKTDIYPKKLINIYTNVKDWISDFKMGTSQTDTLHHPYVRTWGASNIPNMEFNLINENLSINKKNSEEYILEKACSGVDDDGQFFMPCYNIRVFYSRSYTFEQFYPGY